MICRMGRWEPDAKGRIAKAAMELYGKRGFDQTTVAAIAERAGVTERTFFRHFADKREALFGGSHGVQDLMVAPVTRRPASAAPIDPVGWAVHASAPVLPNPEHSA